MTGRQLGCVQEGGSSGVTQRSAAVFSQQQINMVLVRCDTVSPRRSL